MALPLVTLTIKRLEALQRRETHVWGSRHWEIPVESPLPNEPCVISVSTQDSSHCSRSVREHGWGVARGEESGVEASHEGTSRRRADGVTSVRVRELHTFGTQLRDVRR